MDPQQRSLETPGGTARLVSHHASDPRVHLLLSHGAGAGVDTVDLMALARHLPERGVTVHLLEQPWKVAGRRLAGPPATLDVALRAAAAHVAHAHPHLPLVVGGRSAGARSAARCATLTGAAGVLALAFPLHPPGKPERSRLGELLGAGVPTLVIQGDRDAFGRPEEFPAETELCPVPGADHSFRTARSAPITAEEVAALIVTASMEWVEREIG